MNGFTEKWWIKNAKHKHTQMIIWTIDCCIKIVAPRNNLLKIITDSQYFAFVVVWYPPYKLLNISLASFETLWTSQILFWDSSCSILIVLTVFFVPKHKLLLVLSIAAQMMRNGKGKTQPNKKYLPDILFSCNNFIPATNNNGKGKTKKMANMTIVTCQLPRQVTVPSWNHTYLRPMETQTRDMKTRFVIPP